MGTNKSVRFQLSNYKILISNEYFSPEDMLSIQQDCDSKIFSGSRYIGDKLYLKNDNHFKIPEHEKKYSFEKFDCQNNQSLKSIKESLESWSFRRKKGFYIRGPFGSGKTHLLTAFKNNLFFKGKLLGKTCQLFDYSQLIQGLKAYDEKKFDYGIERPKSEWYLTKAKQTDLLLIDDIGTCRGSEHEIEKMFEILNHREQHSKHTFFTSNISLQALGKLLTERVAQRILLACESKVIMTDKSYRTKKEP